jgi:hypothetical protein
MAKTWGLLAPRVEDGIVKDELPYQLQELKRATELIEFPCNFQDGVCLSIRETPQMYSYEWGKAGCCCGDCRKKFGYLRVFYHEFARHYVAAWNNKTGFWRKGKGCALPRYLRSKTCLQFTCSFVNNKLTKLARGILSLLEE